MMDNPYAPPVLVDSDDSRPMPAQPSLAQAAREVFWQWEKLRPIYFLVLSIASIGTALVGASETIGDPWFWILVLTNMIVVNVFYFLGPIAETTMAWTGRDISWLRGTMFVGGTVAASLLMIDSAMDFAMSKIM